LQKFKISITKKDGATVEAIVNGLNPGLAFADFVSSEKLDFNDFNSIFVSNINIEG